MDILDYLKSTRTVHTKGAPQEAQDVVEYLMSEARDITNLEFNFFQVSSSMASHQAIRLDDRWYIVWDNMLCQTCSSLLYALGNYLLTQQQIDAACRQDAQAYPADLCRHTFVSYLANKLVGYPYASAALAMLAMEKVGGVDGLNRANVSPRLRQAALEFATYVLRLQKMMMFFHELSHIIYYSNRDLHEKRIAGVMKMLGSMGETQKADLVYTEAAPVVLRNRRELDPDAPDNIRRHYTNELCCDFQAFYITCRTDSRGRGRTIDWKDALGLSVLASNLLASLEANLNLATKALLRIAEVTDGFGSLSKFNPQIVNEYIGAVRPQLMIREWNTLTCLQLILKEVGPTLGIDAYAFQEQIVDGYKASRDLWDLLIRESFKSLFSNEFLARVFARVEYLKSSRGLSEAEASGYSAQLLGWS